MNNILPLFMIETFVVLSHSSEVGLSCFSYALSI